MKYPYKKGHCVLLGGFRYVIKDINENAAFVIHISDPNGRRGSWILKSKLPIPFAKINI
ncbi:hypothetical protein [Robertmurraya siralis]|uniref:hypothetical protein n=1 Tax=Robertmurraya siralis TaxID=77777 RepID=UPI00147714E5|nr:hypothetical protein [Robertmurraya siralis]